MRPRASRVPSTCVRMSIRKHENGFVEWFETPLENEEKEAN
jgi:hypothetical protein